MLRTKNSSRLLLLQEISLAPSAHAISQCSPCTIWGFIARLARKIYLRRHTPSCVLVFCACFRSLLCAKSLGTSCPWWASWVQCPAGSGTKGITFNSECFHRQLRKRCAVQRCSRNKRMHGDPCLLDKNHGQWFRMHCSLDFHPSVFLQPGFLREHAVPTIRVIDEHIAKLSIAVQFACLHLHT